MSKKNFNLQDLTYCDVSEIIRAPQTLSEDLEVLVKNFSLKYNDAIALFKTMLSRGEIDSPVIYALIESLSCPTPLLFSIAINDGFPANIRDIAASTLSKQHIYENYHCAYDAQLEFLLNADLTYVDQH